MTMFPKPRRAEREASQLRTRKCECGCRDERHDNHGKGACLRCPAGECPKFRPKGLKRGGPIRSGAPRRLAGEDAGRLEFARHGVCVCRMLDGHVCRGDIQASHERNPIGELPTGTGRKEDPRLTCSMCAHGHLDEWEPRAGVFEGWSREQRHDFMAARCAELNGEWDALPDDQKEWWAQQAAVNAKKRAEARRAVA